MAVAGRESAPLDGDGVLTSPRPDFTYSLAVHNSAAHLEVNVRAVAERLRVFESAEIVLVENGSTDRSLDIARNLAAELTRPGLQVRVDSVEKGLGHAHRRGLALAGGRHVLVMGVDIPFGFSDLDQWLGMQPRPALVLGSKSHPASRSATGTGRRLTSLAFRAARSALLGIGAADTQGSIIIDGDLAHRVEPQLRCTDYLVTTEIVAWAMHFGAVALEIPVDYPDAGRSTVSPIGDGMRMLRGMVALRRRLRHTAGALPVPAALEI